MSGFQFSVPNEKNLVCMGDSQTAERSSAAAQGGALLFQTFTYLLAKLKGYGNCWNAGIGGNTTTQMLARFQTDALNHHAGAVGIMGGVNDMSTNISAGVWVGGGITVATTKANIKSMVQQAQAQRCRVTLASPFPIRQPEYLSNIGPYLLAYSQIATETGCEYLNLYTLVNSLTAGQQDAIYVTGDLQHPNTAGHQFLVSNISGNQYEQF
jgi:lysophospholipase L1-like esterase